MVWRSEKDAATVGHREGICLSCQIDTSRVAFDPVAALTADLLGPAETSR
jgi:hypothetical protein